MSWPSLDVDGGQSAAYGSGTATAELYNAALGPSLRGVSFSIHTLKEARTYNVTPFETYPGTSPNSGGARTWALANTTRLVKGPVQPTVRGRR
jgi:hypothetical protein